MAAQTHARRIKRCALEVAVTRNEHGGGAEHEAIQSIPQAQEQFTAAFVPCPIA